MTIQTFQSQAVFRLSIVVPFALLLVVLSRSAPSQTTTGEIVGTITDSSGSLLSEVQVTVTDEGTGERRVLATNNQGQYTATLLPIGNYEVRSERAGFKPTVVTAIRVDVNQTVRIDMSLQVGSTSENIEVTAAVPLLKTDTSDVGTVIGEKPVVELPLNGRNFLQLATLAPGTQSLAHVDTTLQTFGGGVVVNGADSNANLITLDGIENQDYLLPRVGVKLNPDAIAEFKVMTGTYSAEYGRAAGANINVVSKSGTNSFHGGVYEFLRNNALDARNFFDTTKLPPLRQNQFGGNFGGRIIKNKMFFFVSYDGLRLTNGLTIKAIMPTDAQRNGDLSSGPPIFDPLTTRTDPVTGNVIRDPFPGNIIPSNRISTVATNALQLMFPEPQVQTPYQNNAVYNPDSTDNYNQVSVRSDNDITDRDRLWGRFSYNHAIQLVPNFLSSGLPDQGASIDVYTQNDVVGYTRVISPRLVNDARVGYNRWNERELGQPFDKNLTGEIGIQGAVPVGSGGPSITVSGLTAVGSDPFAPYLQVANNFQFIDSLSIAKGPHNLILGADIRRVQLNGTQYPLPHGAYGFAGTFSNDPQNPSSTGQGLADFLLGYPSGPSTIFGTSTYIVLGRNDDDMRLLNEGFYAQDDVKMSRDLTLNLGLRYDYLPQPISARDKIANWDQSHLAVVTAQNDLNSIPTCAGCNGRTLASIEGDFAGIFNFETRAQAGLPRSLVRTDLDGWAPRVGLAWRIPGLINTVLRGGWGRFYEIVAGNVSWNNSAQPPYSRNVSFTANSLAPPAVTLENPFPSTGVAGFPGVGVSAINFRNPYNDNWNVTLQREVMRNVSAEVGYVGARAVGQLLPVDFNSPVFGIADTQSLRPNTQFGSTSVVATWGHSWYDSLQAKLQAQTHTLQLLVSYTWAHDLTVGGGGVNQNLINPFLAWNFFGVRTPVLSGSLSPDDPYLSIDKGPAAADVRNTFVASYVWDLPFGKDRLVTLSGPLDWVAGGWELTGITTIQGGYPIATSYVAGVRPDLISNPNAGAPHSIHEWFNTAAFTAPPSALFVYNNHLNPFLSQGNAGRAPIVGPGIQNWDLGIYKNFPFYERYRVQFRAEMFNAFNRPNFGDPNTAFGTATFGQISSAAPGRIIQFALKFYF